MRAAPTSAYPVPTEPPTYHSSPQKISGGKRFGAYALLDIGFAVTAFVLTILLAWLLLQKSVVWSASAIGYSILLWGLMAYVALPRLHQLMSSLYVPDYFMGRTRTGDGMLGDPVNIAVDGSAEDIHAAFRRAGWVQAEEITLRSTWEIVASSLLRRSYPQAPVSSLYLFGQRHAFAYQQEVDGNPSQRHHVRFWKTPPGWILPGGHRVEWLAAGTYDNSVGLSMFTGQITHKIDADIDLERDYIIDTVRYADPSCPVTVIEDFSTAYHHRNGGGDTVRTDGNLPILDVSGAAERSAQEQPSGDGDSRPKGHDGGEVGVDTREHTDIRDTKLPPLALIVAAIVYGLLIFTVCAEWIALWLGVDSVLAEEEQNIQELLVVTMWAVLIAIMLVGTVRHSKWSRIGMMAMLTIAALSGLANSMLSDDVNFSSIALSAFSVLMVWSVSGDSVRDWVLRHPSAAPAQC